jgi:hypothetical protein
MGCFLSSFIATFSLFSNPDGNPHVPRLPAGGFAPNVPAGRFFRSMPEKQKGSNRRKKTDALTTIKAGFRLAEGGGTHPGVSSREVAETTQRAFPEMVSQSHAEDRKQRVLFQAGVLMESLQWPSIPQQ